MKSYAVLRVAKLKTLGQIGAARGHNTRARPQPHADNLTPLMGGGVRLIAGEADPVQALERRLSETGVKPRKGAVLALEFVASASPEWFRAASPQEREEWMNRTVAFLTKKAGGAANVLAAHLHDDEATPHVHLLAVPLVQKERKKAGRKPKRPIPTNAQDKPQGGPSWALAAADLVGDRRKLEQLQTGYAAAVAPLGIRRGRPRALTGAEHKSPARYRQETAQHAARQQVRIEKEATAILSQVSAAMTVGCDAVEAHQLAYKPADDQKGERLTRGPQGPSGAAWQALSEAVRPAFRAVLAYAKAQAKLLTRERELAAREADVAEGAVEIAQMAGRIALFERTRRPAMAREAASIQDKATRVRERVR